MLANRKIILAFSSVFLLLFFILIALYWYLPTYLENTLIPHITKDLGIADIDCDVRRIGLTGADLGTLQIGDTETTALSVASVQIDYSPGVIFTNYLHRIVLSGIELQGEYSNGTLLLPGFDLDTFLAQPTQVIPFGSLEIRNAVFTCSWEGLLLRLPFELLIVSNNATPATYHCTFRIFPHDREIFLTAVFDSKEGNVLLKSTVDSFPLERFAVLREFIPDLSLAGDVTLKGSAVLSLNPFTFSSVSASCQFHKTAIGYNGIEVRTTPPAGQPDLPFHIALKQNAQDEWEISLSSLSIVSPLPVEVSAHSSLHIMENGMKCSGSSSFKINKTGGEPAGSLVVVEPIKAQGNFTATFEKNGAWEFNFDTAGEGGPPSHSQTCVVKVSDTPITSTLPEFAVYAQGRSGKGSAQLTVSAHDIKVSTQSAPVTIPSVLLNGDLHFAGAGAGKSTTAFEFSFNPVNLSVSSATISLPSVSLTGNAAQHEGSETHFTGAVKFADASVTDPTLNLQAKGIGGTIPLQWPWKSPASPGSILINDLAWNLLSLGSLAATIRQQGHTLQFEGQHVNTLIPGAVFMVTGTSGFSPAHDFTAAINLTLPAYRTPSDIDLGELLSSPGGALFNGELALDGNWNYDTTGMRGSLRPRLKNTKITLKEEDLTIEGLNLALLITDISTLHTAPKQLLSFDKASLGELKMDKGEIEFQIESPESLLIEKSRVNWCGGNVSTQAMRITPGVEDYEFILFCDRLTLAMVLEQFGAAQARGEGTVNGKIPLRFKDGQLSFGDGFLFSTPGDGGNISLTGADILTAGIPPDSPQFAQLELAREALKDFSYEWVKLNMITEGDNVLLRMQLDGAPAQPLPFVYKEAFGGFVKVETGGAESRFEGIQFDLNFSLPLNKILHYTEPSPLSYPTP